MGYDKGRFIIESLLALKEFELLKRATDNDDIRRLCIASISKIIWMLQTGSAESGKFDVYTKDSGYYGDGEYTLEK